MVGERLTLCGMAAMLLTTTVGALLGVLAAVFVLSGWFSGQGRR